jgi:phage gp36-like protein
MNYWATQAEILASCWDDNLTSWLDKDQDGDIDTVSINQVRDAAGSLCMAYIVGRYGSTSPNAWTSSTVPKLLKQIYIQLSIYYAAIQSNNLSVTAKEGYIEAKQILKDIKDEKIDIFDETNATTMSSNSDFGGVEIYPNDTNRVFTREILSTVPSAMRPSVFQASNDDDSDPETSS